MTVNRENASPLELRREGAVMALYVSIVLLAAFAVIPDNYGQGGYSGPPLVAIIWGTTMGLAIAHWFAFEVAALGFRAGRLHRADLQIGTAQMLAAAAVALVTTVVAVVAGPAAEVEAAAFAPAALLGLAGYLTTRAAGRSRTGSIIVGLIVLAAGLGVAALKVALGAH